MVILIGLVRNRFLTAVFPFLDPFYGNQYSFFRHFLSNKPLFRVLFRENKSLFRSDLPFCKISSVARVEALAFVERSSAAWGTGRPPRVARVEALAFVERPPGGIAPNATRSVARVEALAFVERAEQAVSAREVRLCRQGRSPGLR